MYFIQYNPLKTKSQQKGSTHETVTQSAKGNLRAQYDTAGDRRRDQQWRIRCDALGALQDHERQGA